MKVHGGEADTTGPADPVGGSARQPPQRNAASIALILLAGIANVSALALLTGGVGWSRAGAHNLDPPLIFTPIDGGAFATWLASAILLALEIRVARGAARSIAIGCLVTCLAAVLGGCVAHADWNQRYEDGFCLWAMNHLPRDAIVQWNAMLPPASAPATIPAAQWPAEVAALSPHEVVQLPAGQGIVLQWGRLAAWGTSRRVVVCASPAVAPPQDEHHYWRQIAFGVYAAFQGRA